MLEQVELARKAEESTGTDIASMNNSFLLFAHSISDLTGVVVPPLNAAVAINTANKQGLPLSPGIPGTMKDALNDLSEHVDECFKNLRDFGNAVKSGVDRITRPEIDARKEIKSAITNATNGATTIGNMREIMIPSLSQNEKISKEVNKYIEKGEPIKASKTKSLMKDVKSARDKLLTSRTSILTKASRETESFTSSMQKVGESCERRVLALRESLDTVHSEYTQLSRNLQLCAESLRRTADMLDFKADFRSYVEKTKMIRYDIQCLPFMSIDVSHPAFADIDTRINVAVPPLYPVSLAKVVHTFTAESESEISCTKGKHMLLMEKPFTDWVFVMNPLTLLMGYAPRTCLEEIGSQLGVFLKTPSPGLLEVENVRAQQGDYVAIVSEQGDKLTVMTTQGDSIVVPKDLIGIIYN